MRTRRARLPRNVIVLSFVSFFQDAASEMLYPVLPLFLTGVLGAPVAVVGLIEGIAEGTANIMKAVSGRLADLRQKRPLIAAGYGLSSVSKLLIGVATSWPLVLFARFADRTGKGLRTSPRDALIAADTEPSQRGRAFGFHRAADTSGAVVGPLIGLGLYELLDHRLRPLFFVAFVPAVISVALISFTRESAKSAPATSIVRVPLPSSYRRVVTLLVVFGLVNFSDALLIIRAKELGLGFVSIILAYVGYNVVYAALSYPAGTLSDRLPRHLVFAGGVLVFAIAYTGLGLAATSTWVWVLLPVYGAYTALTDGVARAWVADHLQPDQLGWGLGLFQGLQGGAAVLAGVWAGAAWGTAGRLPLVLSGLTAFILATLLVASRRTSWEPVAARS